ncbi:uncharacterized protein TrAFT101_010628 [Trichoderma asperellum]|uniref:uncharacterized protein n=1 Tax=Trichoderma asperellum TaxID=101201 RepID=UPI003324428D|nr:hypothetical protein TrAFT101_010628 [Trichoderma asperellum]
MQISLLRERFFCALRWLPTNLFRLRGPIIRKQDGLTYNMQHTHTTRNSAWPTWPLPAFWGQKLEPERQQSKGNRQTKSANAIGKRDAGSGTNN